MAMVCGLDLHRRQITFDALEVESGEEWRGRIWQPDRDRFRRWLRERRGPSSRAAGRWRWRWRAAPGGGTWSRRSRPPGSRRTWPSRPTPRRPVVASIGPRPTAATPGCCGICSRPGSCRRAGSRPRAVLEWRERVRLYVSLVNQRTVWCQRIHAELYQHGVAVPEGAIRTRQDPGDAGRRAICSCRRRARQRITVGYRMIDATDAEAQPLKKELQRFGARQPACRGPGRRPVRHRRADRGGGVVRARRLPALLPLRAGGAPHRPGRDRRLLGPAPRRRVPVPARTRRRCGGRCTRRPRTPRIMRSPDHDYYAAVKDRHDGKIAAISVARKLARRCYHVLRDVDPDAGLRHPGLNTAAGSDGRDRPLQHQGHPRSAPATGVPASTRAGRPSNTDATALPTHGGHPITIVVADDTSFVEHLGNAGRPHAADRPIHESAPALGLVKVVRPRFAAGAPP